MSGSTWVARRAGTRQATAATAASTDDAVDPEGSAGESAGEVSAPVAEADVETVIAVAELSDGSWWTDTAKVIVTLAACLES